jgi:hypothetical protein
VGRLSFKVVAAIVASCYCFYYANTLADWHLIDGVNLLIHEAGHSIFIFFGEFLHVLMGSGFQVLFPGVFVGYFVLQRAYFSASICLMWVGMNILDVSVYAADAYRMQLPLLGGDGVIHDWNWIFSDLHILQYTDQIAGATYIVGLLVLFAACIGSIYFAWIDSK